MVCGSSIIKYFLFLFNTLFCAGGLAILVIGSIIQVNIDSYGSLFPGEVALPGLLLIVVGGVTFLVAFVGCCGAIRESHWMMITYAVSLVSLFLLQLIGGILAIVFKSDLAGLLKGSMKYAMELYSNPTEAAARQAWDRVQRDFRCCGIDDPWDWIQVMSDFPDSCKCDDPFDMRCVGGHFASGCFRDLSAWIVTWETILGAVALGFALVGAMLAICLATSVRRRMHMV
ncbi:Hypothetical predicted protein [Cloeon dipterum]|uniref:Tetraspanin n=1 Tax=Cloeon dipterum TaxID=197152 RepID=A0A8S1CG18_9INSE|nr:Hypothetical predicted protein [Cloeon dipterum]